MNVLQFCDPTLNIFLNVFSHFLLLISSHSKGNRYKAVPFPCHMLSGTLWTDIYNAYMLYFTTQYQHIFCFSGNRDERSSEELQVRYLLFLWVFHLLFSFRGRMTLWAPGLLLPPLLHQRDLSLANSFWAFILMMVIYCKWRISGGSWSIAVSFKDQGYLRDWRRLGLPCCWGHLLQQGIAAGFHSAYNGKLYILGGGGGWGRTLLGL